MVMLVRTLFVVGLWFGVWTAAGVLAFGANDGAFFGFAFAYLAGFALPWIMPDRLQYWMADEVRRRTW